MGNGERLDVAINLGRARLDRAAGRFWSHRALAALLPDFYFELWSVARAGIPLMRRAEEAALGLGAEPGARELADYLAGHQEEERDHGEWLLEDMTAAGWSREAAVARIPSADAAALVGTPGYYVDHVHPVAVLGYLVAIEGTPPVHAELEAIERRTGLPRAAFRTLHEHASLDPTHRAELRALLDVLPMTPRQSQCVSLCALATIDNVAALLDGIVERRERMAS